MDNQQVQFDYRVKAIQDESRMCKITAAEVEIPIACAAPPGFPNGVPGVWTPETFFLAAIAGYYVHNFQLFCGNLKLQPVSLECEATRSSSSFVACRATIPCRMSFGSAKKMRLKPSSRNST